MDNVIVVAIDRNSAQAHELAVVLEARPDFLPPATLVQSEGRRALLYSREGLVPLTAFGERPGSARLDTAIGLLKGYIRCLISARDMLLDTRLLSSDPEGGVFACRAKGGLVKAVWGSDTVSDENEKICRVAQALGRAERVMGARTSMERMIDIIRSESPSLLNCLRTAEAVCREWNRIAGPA